MSWCSLFTYIYKVPPTNAYLTITEKVLSNNDVKTQQPSQTAQLTIPEKVLSNNDVITQQPSQTAQFIFSQPNYHPLGELVNNDASCSSNLFERQDISENENTSYLSYKENNLLIEHRVTNIIHYKNYTLYLNECIFYPIELKSIINFGKQYSTYNGIKPLFYFPSIVCNFIFDDCQSSSNAIIQLQRNIYLAWNEFCRLLSDSNTVQVSKSTSDEMIEYHKYENYALVEDSEEFIVLFLDGFCKKIVSSENKEFILGYYLNTVSNLSYLFYQLSRSVNDIKTSCLQNSDANIEVNAKYEMAKENPAAPGYMSTNKKSDSNVFLPTMSNNHVTTSNFSKPVTHSNVCSNSNLSWVVNRDQSIRNPQGLKGIKNLGNQCYMDSGLQCLLHLPPLMYHSFNFSPNEINYSSIFGLQGNLTRAWIDICKSMWSSDSTSIIPKELKKVIGQYNSTFADYTQEDSYEFIVSFLDGLHEEIRWPKNNDFSLGLDIEDESELSSEQALDFYRLKHNSIVSNSMHGMNKSTIQCLECNSLFINYEAFIGLSVPISIDNVKPNLYDCLRLYCIETRMGADSYWFCTRCAGFREALKYILISHLPPVLIIHLKRFHGYGNSRRKITSVVDCPIQLEISPSCLANDSEMKNKTHLRKYNLYGVINHTGNLNMGHYTAYCKIFPNNCWYHFNDNLCTEIDPSQPIISDKAYVLFYTREDAELLTNN